MGESTATLALVIKARDMASGQVGKLDKTLRGFKSGALDSLPLGFMGAAGAAALLTGVMAKGLQGAIAEEAGIRRLSTALAANVTGWDGNTAAIEDALKPRMDLAFADDELRDSLATLIPATRNVNKALDVQAVAMDLARMKGISLQDASEALTKVEAGQYRILKSLGIVLKDGATQTEALAAVQAVAAGQAAAYMDTTAGKMELLKVKTDELAESLAGNALPAISDLADTVTGLGGAMAFVRQPTLEASDAWMDFMEAASSFIPLGGPVKQMLAETRVEVKRLGDRAWDAGGKMDFLAERSENAAQTARTAWWTISQIYAALRLPMGRDPLDQMHGRPTVPPPKKKRKPKAGGGWVGLYGPETIDVGERGPERVIPNHQLGGVGRGAAGGVMLQGVTERELLDMVDRGLYFRLRRAGTGA